MKELHYTTSITPLPILQAVDKWNDRYIIQDKGEQTFSETGVKVWKQLIVILEAPLSYENIVAAIVSAKYSNDDVTAITLNYLLAVHNEVGEDKKEEYANEYKTLQAWRQKAKEIAKEVLEYWEENNKEAT